MNIKQLKKIIKDLPDDMEVRLSDMFNEIKDSGVKHIKYNGEPLTAFLLSDSEFYDSDMLNSLEKEAVTEQSIEEAALEYAKNRNGGCRTEVSGSDIDCIAFIAGANHILSSKGLVDREAVVNAIEDFWELHGLFPHHKTALINNIKEI